MSRRKGGSRAPFPERREEGWTGQDGMSLWQQAATCSPSLQIDSSSGRRRAWLKQECDAEGGEWADAMTSGVASDVEQDNTLSSAVSTATSLEGLPPSVLLTITRLQCLLESREERIQALESQVEDLQQDRKFLRSQIENLTSCRSGAAQEVSAPKAGKSQYSDSKLRKRQREASPSSFSSESGSDVSASSAASRTSTDLKKRRHHKERRRGKKGKDYCRKRATGVQYVVHRYKQVLSAFTKKKSMTGAFRHYGIDRNTIANTAPIAELHLAAKESLALVGQFRPGEETLVSFAQKCALVIDTDEELSKKIEQMKATGQLLPITAKRPRPQPAAS
ncbi:coiled-coil domain-containing protein 106-like [Denticeps clupeoides]|uniref:Coiled-coil domain-containing protein 106-like n=1 Tax=Denticeps clupeoides TaxID=299321 RepID=A0AAY4A2V4_9TELE|nr:coiled-coil domain-containing protein 106-like [Denticeps clupeoides]